MLILIWFFLTANILCVSGTSLVHAPCDDKTVEKLSRLAATYIKEDRQTGYKFALNRITNVQAHQQVGKQCCHFYKWKGNHTIHRSTHLLFLQIRSQTLYVFVIFARNCLFHRSTFLSCRVQLERSIILI